MVNDEDIESEVVIVENDDPLKMILDELELLSKEYHFGNVKFKVDSDDINFTNVFQIEVPDSMDESEEKDSSFYIKDKIYNFSRDNNLLKLFKTIRIEFVRL
ncbi:hypothetical protein [Methanobrevibacter wolinii]|uniref:hypothetical protein n=1 Tax=Methanobrevibacter wolinii TaxID=190977 RepID=UPI0005B288A4|nr:hypothetical protein [Methanobrevibacter wolinii]MDD5959617.1 hypothetical protein [Methanobrevibacter wolinii]